MPSAHRNLIVVGTSAGGLEALDVLVAGLPTDLRAAIMIVQHLAPENEGSALLHRLSRYKAFETAMAADGEKFLPGRIYIAPPDHHLLVKRDRLLVTKGARENRYRPAIDPLFRSAAATHGARVIGVLLTGMLDDGTAGMVAIRKCGGVTVVQDPKDAAYPDMPDNALNNADINYCLPLIEIAPLLEKLVGERAGKAVDIPQEVKTEALIAERVLSDVAQVSALGKQVPYNCPNCGGVLWQMTKADVHRYRCHTGHSFTAAALVTSQTEKIEETLWVSLRMFEERKNLLNTMAAAEPSGSRKRSLLDQVKASVIHIDRIRAILTAGQPEVE